MLAYITGSVKGLYSVLLGNTTESSGFPKPDAPRTECPHHHGATGHGVSAVGGGPVVGNEMWTVDWDPIGRRLHPERQVYPKVYPAVGPTSAA
jgi:hypothetical protein